MKKGYICTTLGLGLLVLQGGSVQAADIPISTCAELQGIISNDLAGDYYLTNDIDCTGFGLDSSGNGEGFMPIGDADAPFTGTFDGKGFTISNVSIDRPAMNYVGLFGWAGERDGSAGADISNVTLTNFNITGYAVVGSLFGQLYYSNVENVRSDGNVNGTTCIGGLGGSSRYSSVTHAASSGSVQGDQSGSYSLIFYGGLLGGNERSDLSCSSSDANVTGNYRVGGLVGHNSGTITSSFATGTVEGFYRVGGLAGENISGSISDCYATGAVTGFGDRLPGSHELGGLVGLQYRESGYDGDGSDPVIINSYATGSVTGGIRNMNGVLGLRMNGSCTGTFWDKTTSGVSSDTCGSIGLTTEEMQDQDTYADWDFYDTWMMDGYPVLQCSPDLGNICTFSLGENDTVVFDGTGAEFGDDPAASFPTVDPTVSGTSLQFADTVGIAKQIYVKYPLTSPGTISESTEDITFTVSIDTSAYGNDSDIFVGITDGTNVLLSSYGNQYYETPPGIYAAFPYLNGNIVNAGHPPAVLLPSSAYLPWQIRFTLSDTSSNIMTSVDSQCWTGDLDALDRSAGLELLIGMGGGGFDCIQIDTLKLTADLSPVIDTAIATLQGARDKVDEFDSSIFSNKNNRTNLTKWIDEVITQIEEGLYTDALSKLQGGSVLGKTDGCADSGAPDNNDWILDCSSQDELYELLTQAIGCLEDIIALDPVTAVLSPETGRIWMGRNLGASRVALSSTDEESYGDLYQWGRPTDGHEKRTSGTTMELSSTHVPGHGDFILINKPDPDAPPGPYGYWQEQPGNNDLWQGVDGVNNPCPSGFRLPTRDEFQAELDTWSSEDAAGAFASPLKLPAAGFRYYASGNVHPDVNLMYWTSTTHAERNSYYLRFVPGEIAYLSNTSARGDGMSVRCIKALPGE